MLSSSLGLLAQLFAMLYLCYLCWCNMSQRLSLMWTSRHLFGLINCSTVSSSLLEVFICIMLVYVAPIAQLAKGSDAGGLRLESPTGWVTGKSIPSLWREKHPAIKGRPQEHYAGHSTRTKKTPPSQAKQQFCSFDTLPIAPRVPHSWVSLSVPIRP